MKLDDELCLCFHVSKRKVLNYIRIERPRRVGQLSECYGAGTGCGWCRTYLEKLFRDHAAAAHSPATAQPAEARAAEPSEEPTAEEYARLRARYVRAGGGTPPPGATPVDDADV
ncbi:MAG: bacterioferritin-associated ferredoxin [Pirellulales bacterium]